MDKLYRFWERDSKRSKTGKMFYVMFASRPGKWISSGQDNVRDAVLWSEDHLDNPEGKTRNNCPTLKQFAEDQGLIKENSARKVTPITERHTARGIFTEKEITTLFNQDRKTNLRIWLTFEWYLFFKIQMVCGLRPGEVAALSWGDFHPELSGLVVSKSYDNNSGKIKGLKTEKKGVKERVSILDKKTLDEIQEYFLLKKSPSPFELLFLSSRGNFIRPESSLKHFKASCTRASINLNRRTQYSLRHTFDTDLLKHISRDVVNDLMGHTSYRRTNNKLPPKNNSVILQTF